MNKIIFSYHLLHVLETIPTGGPPTTGPTPNPTEDSPIVIIVSVFASCIILLAFVIISVRCKLAAKSKNLLGSGNQPIRPFLSGTFTVFALNHIA